MEDLSMKIVTDEQVKLLLNEIYKAIDSNDEEVLNYFVGEIFKNIKVLKRLEISDKVRIINTQFLNNLLAIIFFKRSFACYELIASLDKSLDDVKFEKEALIELKNHLKSCKKEKDYECIAFIFAILVNISIMRNSRLDKIDADIDIWYNEFSDSNITYIPPASIYSKTDELRGIIEEGLDVLRGERKDFKVLKREQTVNIR